MTVATKGTPRSRRCACRSRSTVPSASRRTYLHPHAPAQRHSQLQQQALPRDCTHATKRMLQRLHGALGRPTAGSGPMWRTHSRAAARAPVRPGRAMLRCMHAHILTCSTHAPLAAARRAGGRRTGLTRARRGKWRRRCSRQAATCRPAGCPGRCRRPQQVARLSGSPAPALSPAWRRLASAPELPGVCGMRGVCGLQGCEAGSAAGLLRVGPTACGFWKPLATARVRTWRRRHTCEQNQRIVLVRPAGMGYVISTDRSRATGSTGSARKPRREAQM